jgi:hypothetical protein
MINFQYQIAITPYTLPKPPEIFKAYFLRPVAIYVISCILKEPENNVEGHRHITCAIVSLL